MSAVGSATGGRDDVDVDVDQRGGVVVPLEAGAQHRCQRAEDRSAEDRSRPSVAPVSDDVRLERRALQRAAEGDPAAWAALVDAHLERVWSLAVLLTRHPHDAAVVCETVWLRLAQDLPAAEEERLASWLARVVWEEARRAAPASVVVGRRRTDAPPRGRVLPLPRSRGRMS